LGAAVRKGRAKFLEQFPSCAATDLIDRMPDPGAPGTVVACRLDWSETERAAHQESLSLHRDLIALRRSDPVIALQGEHGARIDGAVLSGECFAVRFQAPDGDDRLLIVNLGRDLRLRPLPEPVMAAPEDKRWTVLFSTESPRYGGGGTPAVDDQGEGWHIPGHAAVLLQGVAVT
jgi:maltooligosyltrehalose trehalohydrolase